MSVASLFRLMVLFHCWTRTDIYWEELKSLPTAAEVWKCKFQGLVEIIFTHDILSSWFCHIELFCLNIAATETSAIYKRRKS